MPRRSPLALVPAVAAVLLLGALAVPPAANAELSPERAASHGLLRRALFATARGDHDAAADHLREALALQEKGGDPYGRAECLWMLGAVRSRQGHHREALDLYARAGRLYDELDDPLGRWLTAYGTAELAGWLGHLEEAERSARDGLAALTELRRRTAAGQTLRIDSVVGFAYAMGIRPEMVESAARVVPPDVFLDMPETLQRTTLGVIQREQGRWHEALETLDQARRLAQRSRLMLPRVLNRIGEVHLADGELDAAEDAFSAALERSRDLPGTLTAVLRWVSATGPGDPEAEDAAPRPGGLLSQILDSARDIAVRSLPDLLDATGASSLGPFALLRADELQALANLSRVALARGDFDDAARLLEKSHRIADALGSRDVALALDLTTARLEVLRGSWDEADRALSTLYDQAADQGMPLLEIQAKAERATLWLVEGRFEGALRGQLEALDQATNLGLVRRRAALLGAVAETRLALGDDRTAARELAQGRALATAAGDRPTEIDLLVAEARVLQRIGREGGAERRRELALQGAKRCGRAVELAEELGWGIRTARALVCRGVLFAEVGQSEGAQADLERAVSEARAADDRSTEAGAWISLGDLELGGGRPQEAAASFHRADTLVQEIDAPWYRLPVLAGLGAALLDQGRSEEAIAMLERAATLADAHGGSLRLPELQAGLRDGLPTRVHDALVGLYADRGQISRAFAHSERSRARAFLQSLGDDWLAAGSKTARLATLERQRRAVTRQLTAVGDRTVRTRAARAALFDRRDRLDDRIADEILRLRLEHPAETSLAGLAPRSLEEIESLLDDRTTLVQFHVLQNRTFVWVVRHGDAALVRIDAGAATLSSQIEHFEQAITAGDDVAAPAAVLYRELWEPIRRQAPGARVILVPHGPLHDLSFCALRNPETGRYLVQDHLLVRVPSASAFVALHRLRHDPVVPVSGPRVLIAGAVGKDLPAARRSVAAIARLWGVTALTGDAATEREVRRLAPDATLVHLAVHGRLRSGTQTPEALLLAPGSGDDGRLEIREILGLPLEHAPIVVLAACRGAAGPVAGDDDRQTLARAFLSAGARAVIAAGRPVVDRDAGALMEAVHRQLRKGRSAAEALRHAQIEAIDASSRHHPRSWALFSVEGIDATAPQPFAPRRVYSAGTQEPKR